MTMKMVMDVIIVAGGMILLALGVSRLIKSKVNGWSAISVGLLVLMERTLFVIENKVPPVIDRLYSPVVNDLRHALLGAIIALTIVLIVNERKAERAGLV